MKETIAKINEVVAALQADLAKAAEGNKAAAARARKATLELEKLGKAFAQLKKDETIVSPVRCRWQPAEQYRTV